MAVTTQIDSIDLNLTNEEKRYAFGIARTITLSDNTNLTSAATRLGEWQRVGNMEFHVTLPIQNAIQGVVWDWQNQRINYWLSKTNAYRKADNMPSKLDGTDGYWRNYVPEFYGHSVKNASFEMVLVSTQPLSGYGADGTTLEPYFKIPACVIDTCNGTIDQTNNRFCCVINTGSNFRGGQNVSTKDREPLGITSLGKPRTGVISLTSMCNTYAKNAKSYPLFYDVYKWVFVWLWCIEYCTNYSQNSFNKLLTKEHYHQGGMGAGVTQVEPTDFTDGTYAVTPIGYFAQYGNLTRMESLTISNSTTGKVYMPFSWRGFQNTFGDIWTVIGGGYVGGMNADGTASDSYNGLWVPRTTIDGHPTINIDAGYQTSGTANMTMVARQIKTNGFGFDIDLGSYGEISPLSVNGTADTGTTDYNFQSGSPITSSPRQFLFDGASYSGINAGLLCLISTNDVGAIGRDVGGISFNPLIS